MRALLPESRAKNRLRCSDARTFARIAREEQVATLQCAHFCQNRARRTNCQVMQDSPASGSRQFCHRSAGSGQRPGARRAFNRAPRSARAVAAGSRILRRRCHATSLPCCSVALLPLPSPSALRASKHAILGSRPWKYTPPCPKTCHFGFPTLEIHPSVPQNMPFWTPNPGNTALPLGRTRTFCPSAPRPHAGSLGPQQKWGRSCNLLRRFFYFCICINR